MGNLMTKVFIFGWLKSKTPSQTDLNKYQSWTMSNIYNKCHVFRGLGHTKIYKASTSF